MKGLFKKDLLMIWQSRYLLLVIGLGVSLVLIRYDAAIGLMTFLSMFLLMQEVSTVTADRMCGFNLYETTFPVSRKNAVRQKYLLSLGIGILGMAIGFILYLCLGGEMGTDDFYINLMIALIGLFSVFPICIPLAYLLPRSQFFVAILISFVPFTGFIFAWSQSITSEALMKGTDVIGINMDLRLDLLGYFCLASLAILLISWFAVPAWMAKRDQN